MEVVQVLTHDYQQFPHNQTYDLYATDVYFRDPLITFRGIKLYRAMIQFMERWFIDARMDLHAIEQRDREIHTRWTLWWKAPLPWKPQMMISGQSEITLNEAGLITRHIDTWDCSKLDVLKQLLYPVQERTFL